MGRIISNDGAKEGESFPTFVSSDFVRGCKESGYRYFESDTGKLELEFLLNWYESVEQVIGLARDGKLVRSNTLDIVWCYSSVKNCSGNWSGDYLSSKMRMIREFEVMLDRCGQLCLYESLPAFQSLDVRMVAQDRILPTSWWYGNPVTNFHKHLYRNAEKVLKRLPDVWFWRGYLFCKSSEGSHDSYRDNCFACSDSSALFWYCNSMVVVGMPAFVLFDIGAMLFEATTRRETDLSPSLSDILKWAWSVLSSIDLVDMDLDGILRYVFENFVKSFVGQLYPFIGSNKKLLVKMVEAMRYGW
jgi:hypothetical protein